MTSRISYNTIDLSQLPPPSIVELLSNDEIFSQWLDQFLTLAPDYSILLESDPAIKLLEVGGYREMVLRQRVNDALKAVLLPLSYGTNLDAIGARFDCDRLVVQQADPTTSPPTPVLMENDTSYKQRIMLAPDAFAAAGPYGAYLYQARTADPNIIDVQAYNFGSGLVNPGQVLVAVLTSDDSTMDAAVSNTWARLHRDDIQPFTTDVLVRGAKPISYELYATLYIGSGPDPDTVKTNALNSANTYIASRRKIGKRTPVAGLGGALSVAGVDYADLVAPTADVVPDLLSYCEPSEISISVVVN